jgi:hypothetical protein
MSVLPADVDGVPAAFEFQGADKSLLQELKALFSGPGEQVVVSDAFGGSDALIVIAAFGRETLEKLIGIWPKLKASSPKTTLKIDKSSITMQGFSRGDVEALLASPNLAKAIRLMKAK